MRSSGFGNSRVVSASTTDTFLPWRKSSLPWKHSLDIGLTETRPCVGYAQLLKTLRIMSPPSQMMSRLAQTREGEVPLHLGPEVASVPMSTSPRLHDPGDGLNGNGRRVLTYADLRALYKGVDGRPPTREIILHLTGNMVRFIWGFDAYKFSQAEPIHLKLGERVRFVLINDSMMEHPIHLHGLWSELENGNGEFSPYKHTLIVKPAERVSYLVSADTRGRWAFHCHLQYHMEAGMFRTVIVS